MIRVMTAPNALFKRLRVLVMICLPPAAAAASPAVLVAGYDSDNVVFFDLEKRQWSELVRLPKGSQPRGITVSPGGEIFLGLHGGERNVVRLVRKGAALEPRALTPTIGRFGPGFILHGGSRIWAAGDTDRVIYEIDPVSGGVTAPEQYKNRNNIVGLAVDGRMLYAAEYFQRSILRYPLADGPLRGERLVENSKHLDRPVGMTIGHDGHLYVANGLRPTVVKFDSQTGAYMRTLADLGVAGKPGIHSVLYSPEARRYYIAAGSDVHELDTGGKEIAIYSSPALQKAYGMALVPAALLAAIAGAGGEVAATGTPAPPPEAGLGARPVTTLMTTPGRLSIRGIPGERYRVLATTDFVDWTPIRELVNSTGELDFTDPDTARFTRRFYKLELVTPPR